MVFDGTLLAGLRQRIVLLIRDHLGGEGKIPAELLVQVALAHPAPPESQLGPRARKRLGLAHFPLQQPLQETTQRMPEGYRKPFAQAQESTLM